MIAKVKKPPQHRCDIVQGTIKALLQPKIKVHAQYNTPLSPKRGQSLELTLIIWLELQRVCLDNLSGHLLQERREKHHSQLAWLQQRCGESYEVEKQFKVMFKSSIQLIITNYYDKNPKTKSKRLNYVRWHKFISSIWPPNKCLIKNALLWSTKDFISHVCSCMFKNISVGVSLSPQSDQRTMN